MWQDLWLNQQQTSTTARQPSTRTRGGVTTAKMITGARGVAPVLRLTMKLLRVLFWTGSLTVMTPTTGAAVVGNIPVRALMGISGAGSQTAIAVQLITLILVMVIVMVMVMMLINR